MVSPLASTLDGVVSDGCDVLFLVKNGSGFGHIRRAVLLAKRLDTIGVRPVIFSQASSLVLYDDPRLRVVNFPLLDRLKTSAAEEVFAALLDAVGGRLDPALLVEDTYPDRRYRSVPSLRGLPRLLVLRRLDAVSFEHLRSRGEFSHYDRILLTQSPEDFHDELHTPASLRLVESSGRFRFVGPVFCEPPADEVRQVRQRFTEPARPLVVVNAGSGGDQLNDAFADRLFTAARRLACECRQRGVDAQFVMVLGPYYRGRPIPEAENVHVVGFEPQLAALMQAATVAVIRPGHNVVHEALAGDAELVLVPGIPWMEGQREFAESIAERFGSTVVDVDDETSLRQAVMDAVLGDRRRRRHALLNGTATAAEAIAGHLRSVLDGPTPELQCCLVAVTPPASMDEGSAGKVVGDVLSADVPVIQHAEPTDRSEVAIHVPIARRLSRRTEPPATEVTRGAGHAVYVDQELPAGIRPDDLSDGGPVVLLYPDEGDIGPRTRQWLAFSGDHRASVVDAPLDRVRANLRRLNHLGWLLAAVVGRTCFRGLLLDCTLLDEQGFGSYLVAVRVWLDKLGAYPMDLQELGRHRVVSLHGEDDPCR